MTRGAIRVGGFVLAAALAGSLVTACPMHSRVPPPPSEPLPIPTTAQAPADDESIRGEMQPIGPCLTLLIREGDDEGGSVLPIWSLGFAAKGGEGQGWLLTGPMESTGDALNSERLELRGSYVDVAPADAIVPAGCERYPLFLAGHVRNVS